MAPAALGAIGVAAALATVSSACAHASGFVAPVTTFRDASAVVIESTGTYLTALNKTERDHYLDERVATQAPIALREIEDVQVFDAHGIALRLEALDRVADYTDLLYRLATSDAPGAVRVRARDLSAALSKLSVEVDALAGRDDARFKRATGLAVPLIDDVLQAVAERTIHEALKQAVIAGAGPVDTLLTAIEHDTALAYERKRSALSKRRSDAAAAYNLESSKGSKASPAALRRLADDVSEVEDHWEAFRIARPTDGLEAMRRAAHALETFARAPRPGAATSPGSPARPMPSPARLPASGRASNDCPISKGGDRDDETRRHPPHR